MQLEKTMAAGSAASPRDAAPGDLSPVLDAAFTARSGIAVDGDGERLCLLVREGTDPDLLFRFQRQFARPFTLSFLPEERFRSAVAAVQGDLQHAPGATPAAEQRGCTTGGADVRMLHAILADAVARGASDVHLEPGPGGGVVQLRIAGILRESLHLPRPLAARIARAIQALAGLHDGAARPQQGQFPMDGAVQGNVTVASLPGRLGERFVLRPCAAQDRHAPLTGLGMPRRMAEALGPVLLRSGGLVIVTGPEGAGKATTMRALVRRLQAEARMVLAVARSGDMPIPGVARLEVDPARGLDLAEGMRAVCRQDPDAIVLCEIADRATASAALHAAQAGHVVLAAIETRDAVSAIAALRALKVEPFLLASALGAVLSQRLVRRLCSECREPVQAHGSVSALLGFDPGAIVYAPSGCEACGGTGFSGRTAVFECLVADPAIRRLINDGGDEAILARHAFLNAPNLGSAARALVRDGVTTPEEAVAVARSAAAPPVRR